MRGSAEAEHYAEAAIAKYGPRNAKLPRLAYDAAYFWTLEGRFSDAVRVLKVLVQHFHAPADRMLAFSLLARSAGGAGESDIFEEAELVVRQLAGEPAAVEQVAPGWLGLAHGAASLGRWTLARDAATRALEASRLHRQCIVMFEAESILENARTGTRAIKGRETREDEPGSLSSSLNGALSARR